MRYLATQPPSSDNWNNGSLGITNYSIIEFYSYQASTRMYGIVLFNGSVQAPATHHTSGYKILSSNHVQRDYP